jgi:hypothetical protein
MNLTEQVYRSRKLMCENHEDKLSLIESLLNDFLSFDGNIQYKVVYENVDDIITGFNVEATIDSSMYHKVSPDYNEDYNKFVNLIDDKIYKLVEKYFTDEVQYEVVVFFHKNVDKVVSISKPMLQKAMDVYSRDFHYPNLKFEFVSSLRNPELIIFVKKDVENGLAFNHSSFLETLNGLYYDRNGYGLFDDFFITATYGYQTDSKNVTKIYESVIDGKVICDNCGWSWALSDGGDDPYTCHECGQDNLDS